MKTVNLIIKPLKETNYNIFPTAYNYNGKMRIWTDGNQIVECELTAKEFPSKKDISFNKSKTFEPLQYLVPEQPREDVHCRGIHQLTKDIHVKFLANHPYTVLNGKPHPNTKTPLYNVIDLDAESKAKVSAFESKLKVANMIYSMNESERCDLLYWYGTSPKGKSASDILFELADFENGLCMISTEKFLESWGASAEQRIFTINLRKALDNRLIEERNDNGNISYYVQNNFIGICFDDIMAYMQKNEKVYTDNILRQLNVEVVKEEKQKKTAEAKNEAHAVSGKISEGQIKALKEEAKKLYKDGFIGKIHGMHLMSYNKLLPIVEHGRTLAAAGA